ncbi:MAG: heme exporter protein CcmD [Pseudomonadota bacterium]
MIVELIIDPLLRYVVGAYIGSIVVLALLIAVTVRANTQARRELDEAEKRRDRR